MLDLLSEEAIGDMLDAHLAKLLDTKAAANRLSQRLLTSNTFTAHTAALVRLKRNTALNHKYSTALATKDLIDTVQKNNDVDDSAPRSYFGTAEKAQSKVPRRRSSHHHSQRKTKDANRHLSLSKSSKEQYKSRSRMELEDAE